MTTRCFIQDTQFVVYLAPHEFDLTHVQPTAEVAKIEWLTPTEALADFKSGKVSMMPPQFYLMTLLAEQGLGNAF